MGLTNEVRKPREWGCDEIPLQRNKSFKIFSIFADPAICW